MPNGRGDEILLIAPAVFRFITSSVGSAARPAAASAHPVLDVARAEDRPAGEPAAPAA